jgi:hypothetical protein
VVHAVERRGTNEHDPEDGTYFICPENEGKAVKARCTSDENTDATPFSKLGTI